MGGRSGSSGRMAEGREWQRFLLATAVYTTFANPCAVAAFEKSRRTTFSPRVM